MQIQGKVLAQQSHALRLLSAKLNPGADVKIGKMIQKLTGTELRHELEGLAIDVMGEIGTLYEDSPHLKNDGTWQFHIHVFSRSHYRWRNQSNSKEYHCRARSRHA
jgi:hypothetical protein